MRAGYDLAALSPQDALSYRLFDAQAQRAAALEPYEDYGWFFDQMNGAQSDLPAFLINTHVVQNADHARAYVERIRGLGPLIDTLTSRAAGRADNGVMPPDWVYPYVLSDIRNLVDAGAGNAILEDFRTEVDKLDLSESEKANLVLAAEGAWRDSAAPAYER